VLQIAQNMDNLTVDQERIRESALKELRVPHDRIEISYEAQIGQGGFGVVYKGRYGGHPVAVKVINFLSHSAQKRKILQSVSIGLLYLM